MAHFELEAMNRNFQNFFLLMPMFTLRQLVSSTLAALSKWVKHNNDLYEPIMLYNSDLNERY